MGLQRARLGETPRGPLLHPTGKTHTAGSSSRWGMGRRQKGAIGHPRGSSRWSTHRPPPGAAQLCSVYLCF